MNEAEKFLLAFHGLHPGCTSLAFASGRCLETGLSSYGLLASLAAEGERSLDLGCGDGHLVELLRQRPSPELVVGLDLSRDELARARTQLSASLLLRARAQGMPFADRCFSLVVSHLAFHLMGEIELVVAEVARVLAPGGRFAAIVGGGPKIGSSFELFLELMAQNHREEHRVPRIGDMRARTEDGLISLFGEHLDFEGEPRIDDYVVDFGGCFDELWPRLAQVYDLMYYSPHEHELLREGFRRRLGVGEEDYIPCTMAIRRVICQRRAT